MTLIFQHSHLRRIMNPTSHDTPDAHEENLAAFLSLSLSLGDPQPSRGLCMEDAGGMNDLGSAGFGFGAP